MSAVGLLIGFLIAGIGIFGIAAPERFLTAARSLQTPLGLYLVAALRIAFGVVLIRMSPVSRAPKALRVLGFVTLAAGLVTPFFGVERARTLLDWWQAQGPTFMRVWAGVAVAFGVFVVYAVGLDRRAA